MALVCDTLMMFCICIIIVLQYFYGKFPATTTTYFYSEPIYSHTKIPTFGFIHHDKVLVQPKMKILPLFAYSNTIPNLYDFE